MSERAFWMPESAPIALRRVLDARSQFVSLACGALVSSSPGPHDVLSAALRATLANGIGPRWVVSCSREIGFSVRGNDFFPCGTCSLAVFVGVSHTLGVVWHRWHVFGGTDWESLEPPDVSFAYVGCYLGNSKWMSIVHEGVIETPRDLPVYVMNAEGRFVGRVPGSEQWQFFTGHHVSNGKWLVYCNQTQLWVWRLNSGLPVGQCVKLEIDRICRLRVRFQPFGDDDHVVVVTWDVDSELLVVDLQRSFGSGSLTITKTVALPIGRALDVLCLPCGENITLHDTGGVFTVYHTGTKQPVVLKGGIVEFIQPSHVCVSRGLCGMIYSVSDMGSLQLHLQISMHRLLKELSVFGQEETGDTSISYRFHDVVTGKELFVLTRTLPNRSTGKTQLEQHFCISRPPSPPWPTSSPLWD